MTTWAIADIHGCYYTFKQLLEEVLQISPDDHIYLLGDMVDRGPHTQQVLDYIMLLQQQGYHIMPVQGNHEYFVCTAHQMEQSGLTKHWWNKSAKQFVHTWLHTGGTHTLKSFGVSNALDIPEHYIHWLQALPTHYITPTAILTHAGLNCSSPHPYEDTDTLLFGTHSNYNAQYLQQKYVIHGHNAVSLDGIYAMLRNIDKNMYLCIDNGCVYAGHHDDCGHLMALNLNNFTFEKQIYID